VSERQLSSENELGNFLRTRREAITPAEVGLPTGSRRRTPGLRRSELAALAGISVEYLVRLEQGRDRNPSPQVVGALADALRLQFPERAHLREIIKTMGGGSALCPSVAPPPGRTVRPTVRMLLARLEPSPAVLLNRLNEITAMTQGFERFARPTGLLDAEQPSLIRYVFTDPRAKEVFPDWSAVADRQLADIGVWVVRRDPYVMALADELTVLVGGEFTHRLATVSGPARHSGVDRWRHPTAGELRLAFEVLELPDSDDQRMFTLLPADHAAESVMDRLQRRPPGALRAI
jgi:transcriptional regulator with XRE-family HTH domain